MVGAQRRHHRHVMHLAPHPAPRRRVSGAVLTARSLPHALRCARTHGDECIEALRAAEIIDAPCMLGMVGVATDRRVPTLTRVAVLDALATCRATPEAQMVLRRSYGVLFSCDTHESIRHVLFPLLCVLTERRHVRAFRIRALLALYDDTKDACVYDLLDTYAMYEPSLLLPADAPPRPMAPVSWHAWRQALGRWNVPEVVPGLSMPYVGSRVPRCIRAAAMMGHDAALGKCLAASFGRLLAAHYAQHRHRKRSVDVPPYEPRDLSLLEGLCVYVEPLPCLPLPLVPILAHVIRCMGHEALRHLSDHVPLQEWERAWTPTLHALARLFRRLPPLAWDDAFPMLIRPLCHLAVMDGVSDVVSAMFMRVLVHALEGWRNLDAPGTQALLACLVELQDALLLDGDPSIAMYVETLHLHAVVPQAGTFPCPFIQLATPTAMQGSILTLDRLCAHVLQMRRSVLASEPHTLDAHVVDAMATALIDMVWSGRAFGQFVQRGLVVDGVMTCDRGAMAVIKQACDELRIVPFVLVASLSHGALLAPLFEQYCNTVLLPGHDIRAPITPSALRGARGAGGLPEHVQYADIRRGFLEWLAGRGAPHLLALLEAFVPSLSHPMLHGNYAR